MWRQKCLMSPAVYVEMMTFLVLSCKKVVKTHDCLFSTSKLEMNPFHDRASSAGVFLQSYTIRTGPSLAALGLLSGGPYLFVPYWITYLKMYSRKYNNYVQVFFFSAFLFLFQFHFSCSCVHYNKAKYQQLTMIVSIHICTENPKELNRDKAIKKDF